ncbi:MAG TPA: hypothetical protein PLZ84_09210, partial [Clostridia bacterium]|nr:hypothetical protein [Clostridia bacterium]
MQYKNAKETMKLKLDLNNMFASTVGKYGFEEEEFIQLSYKCKQAKEKFDAYRGKDMMGWTGLPYNQKEIVDDILATAEYIRSNFDD